MIGVFFIFNGENYDTQMRHLSLRLGGAKREQKRKMIMLAYARDLARTTFHVSRGVLFYLSGIVCVGAATEFNHTNTNRLQINAAANIQGQRRVNGEML